MDNKKKVEIIPISEKIKQELIDKHEKEKIEFDKNKEPIINYHDWGGWEE